MKTLGPIDLRRRSFMPLRFGFIIIFLLAVIASLFIMFPPPLPGTGGLLFLSYLDLQLAYLAFIAKDKTLYSVRDWVLAIGELARLFD